MNSNETSREIPTYYERYRLATPDLRFWRRRSGTVETSSDDGHVETSDPTDATNATHSVAEIAEHESEPPESTEVPAGDVARSDEDIDEPLPECRCGFDKHHHFIRPHCEFNLAGWILITIGVNPPPRAVRLQCAHCGDVIERVSDPDEIHEMAW